MGENEACLEVLMRDETYKNRWQNRHVQSCKTEPSTTTIQEQLLVLDTQQIWQTQTPPIRVKAAPSNLKLSQPSGLPPVKSPPPHDSGTFDAYARQVFWRFPGCFFTLAWLGTSAGHTSAGTGRAVPSGGNPLPHFRKSGVRQRRQLFFVAFVPKV